VAWRANYATGNLEFRALADSLQAALDSLARAEGHERANRLHARGYLAGRLAGIAVGHGALCCEEIAAALKSQVAADPYSKSRGFIQWDPALATLPVYAVKRGRAEIE
jgi:hypothetical protein